MTGADTRQRMSSNRVSLSSIRQLGGFLPQPQRLLLGVQIIFSPPLEFVAMIMEGAMVDGAKRDHPLITGFAPKCARLNELEVVGLTGVPAADHAVARRHELQVVLIADPSGAFGKWAGFLGFGA